MGRIERDAHQPLDRRSKVGAPDVRDTPVMPAVPQMPRISARDRLFKLMQTATPKPPARPRPPNPAAPGTPTRNAIGIRTDPGAPAGTASQRPAHLARAGTTPITPPPLVANAWHQGVVAPAPSARGALNGTTLVHVGSGAPVIGGPAKVVTGINGTTLRSKH
jgi:hypothetical protein